MKGASKGTLRAARRLARAGMPAAFMVISLLFSGCPGPSPPAELKIAALSVMSAAPLTLLRIKVENLDPALPHTLIFSDDLGFYWDAPVVGIEGDEVLVGVPVYVDQQTGLWRPGQVTLTLRESAPGSNEYSNEFAGFQIESPPFPTVPSGQLTLSFLLGLRDYSEALRLEILRYKPSAEEQAPALGDLHASLGRLADDLGKVVGGNETQLRFGHFEGEPLVVTPASLALTDRLVLALLNAAAAVEGIPQETVRVASVGGASDFSNGGSAPCAGLSASELQPTLNDFIEANMRGERPTSQRYLSSIVNCAPTAAVTALEVVGASGGIAIAGAGAAGAGAAELALPSLALFSVKASVTGWLISVGHHLRGINDEAARKALEEGSKIVEEALQSQLKALRDALRPEPTPSDPAKAHADEILGHGCTLLKHLKGWECPKVEDILDPTFTTPAPTTTTKTTTTPTTAPATEEFLGSYSGDWGTLTSNNGCQWKVTFSGTLRVSLTTSSGQVEGPGTASVTIYWTVTYQPSGVTCTDSPLTDSGTGTMSGTTSSMSGTFASSGPRQFSVTFQGSRAGDAIGGSGTASRYLSTTSTEGDTPPELHSDEVQMTLVKQ